MSAHRQINQIDTLLLFASCTYIGALVLSNLVNVTRIIVFEPSLFNFQFTLYAPIGLMCYPITFLCTDIICELYGKPIATKLIWVGLIVNLLLCGILYLTAMLPYQTASESDPIAILSKFGFASTFSSSCAYLVAQHIDVQIFHFLKEKFNGRHLWLRNNASTLISQMLDTVIVIGLMTVLTGPIPTNDSGLFNSTLSLILSIYCFKAVMAFLDTAPLYLIVWASKPKPTSALNT